MRLKGLFIIGKHQKSLNNQNPNPERFNSKSLWVPLGLFGQPTSQGRNLAILSLFDVYDTSLERSIRSCGNRHDSFSSHQEIFAKKHRLGPQNGSGSLGPKKLPKIVNCATIKETKKLKETMVRVQVE